MKPRLKMNFGLSNKDQTVKGEIEKIELAIKEGVDIIQNISIEKDKLDSMREVASNYKNDITIFNTPIYETLMYKKSLIEIMEKHYDSGVRGFTLHMTPRAIFEEALNNYKNFTINSRGGLFLINYFKEFPNKENPCLVEWEEIKKFVKSKKDCEIFIGTALRPGHTNLSEDDIYLKEINSFKENNLLEFENTVLEAGGHIKFKHFQKYADIIGDAPTCLMGPLITEATNQYDHVTSIMGQTFFAQFCKI